MGTGNVEDYTFYYLGFLSVYAIHNTTGEMIAYHPTVAISRKQFDATRQRIREYKLTDEFKKELEAIKNPQQHTLPSS